MNSTDYKNKVICGNNIDVMNKMPDESIDLVVTSPPYYNAKSYSQYKTYEEYLDIITDCCRSVLRILKPGRHLIINTSPVITPRESRSHNSTRRAIPFDLHGKITKLGFDFCEDIIWEKPSGAGNGRSRRFFIDRKPLQYKPETITEYVMIYRKHTDMLPETVLKKYSKKVIKDSLLIDKDVNMTNVWRINPAYSKKHPAIFPEKLVRDLICLYSLKNDTVMDPFCGSGTTLFVAKILNRNYIGIDISSSYCKIAKQRARQNGLKL